jgi:hypothetical protein
MYRKISICDLVAGRKMDDEQGMDEARKLSSFSPKASEMESPRNKRHGEHVQGPGYLAKHARCHCRPSAAQPNLWTADIPTGESLSGTLWGVVEGC